MHIKSIIIIKYIRNSCNLFMIIIMKYYYLLTLSKDTDN